MIAKGNRTLGEDFLEVGDGILDALELASPITWELAHRELLRADLVYPVARWSYSICGIGELAWPVAAVTDAAGTDGGVRWAGSALDTRKLTVDLSRHGTERVRIEGVRERDVPLAFVPERHHGALLSRPTGAASDAVRAGGGITGIDQQSDGDRGPSRVSTDGMETWVRPDSGFYRCAGNARHPCVHD